ARRFQTLLGCLGADYLGAASTARMDRRRAATLQVRKEHPLKRVCPSYTVLLEPRREDLGASLAEELLRALRYREQSYDPLFGLDDAPLPSRKIDAEWLREAAHHVED